MFEREINKEKRRFELSAECWEYATKKFFKK